ncbi:MAG TPA: AIR synthase-related protein, partial [Thermoanaerobaculia bacterium]
DELGGSEYQQLFHADALAAPPRVSLADEKTLIELMLDLHAAALLRSAHDLSNGGLAVALAEASMGGVGCHVDLAGHADDADAIALLFSESQARVVVSCTAENRDEVLRRASAAGIAAQRIGHTSLGTFLIERNNVPLIKTNVPELTRVWRTAFALLLGGDTIDEVIRGVGEEAAEVLGH